MADEKNLNRKKTSREYFAPLELTIEIFADEDVITSSTDSDNELEWDRN